jgi:hypothetical protein
MRFTVASSRRVMRGSGGGGGGGACGGGNCDEEEEEEDEEKLVSISEPALRQKALGRREGKKRLLLWTPSPGRGSEELLWDVAF